MSNISTAEIFRVGLILHYFKIQDVVEWADSKVLSGEKDEKIIELSLSINRSVSEVLSILNSFSDSPGS